MDLCNETTSEVTSQTRLRLRTIRRARACDGDVAAVRKRRSNGPQHAVLLAGRTLVQLAGTIAKSVSLRVSVIRDPSYPFWEAVCVLSQVGISHVCQLSIAGVGFETARFEDVPRCIGRNGPVSWS